MCYNIGCLIAVARLSFTCTKTVGYCFPSPAPIRGSGHVYGIYTQTCPGKVKVNLASAIFSPDNPHSNTIVNINLILSHMRDLMSSNLLPVVMNISVDMLWFHRHVVSWSMKKDCCLFTFVVR